jgi:hypothetical protein
MEQKYNIMEHLRTGQRYMFTVRPEYQHIIKSFRATYLDVIGKYSTLRVIEREDCGGMTTMPLGWIVKAETLEEITNFALDLNSDVLLIIDEFA